MTKPRFLKRPDNLTAVLLFSPLWMELVFRGAHLDGMFSESLLYLIPLSLSVGAFLWLISSLFGRLGRAVAALLCFLSGFVMCAVMIYYDIFSVMPALYSITGANQAAQFWREVLSSMGHLWPWILLTFLPVFLILSPSCAVSEPPRRLTAAISFVLIRLAAVLLTVASGDGVYSPRELYTGDYMAMRSVRLFGVQTSAFLDARSLAIGSYADADIPVGDEPVSETEENIPGDIEYNSMDFDFKALAAGETNKNVASLHRYFATQKPSAKNEYTGLFEGKNLVLITAEGWSPYAVSKELTPTLYKMLNEGFVFGNFYNPIWGVSTTDGEYAACIGLIPKSGVWSFYQSRNNYLPLCMGKQLSSLGYTAKAYHDHLYDYYSRDLTHPNMGYDYKGYGNGLNVTYIWPESDLEMIELSVDEYISSEPFIAYYMTVSGHLNYTFSGNNMARLHRDVVDSLELSDDAKAYIACNYELELAVTELLSRLEETGIADDTVFCIVPDHYPYGLTEEAQNELAGHTVDRQFEIYESCLALWSPSMEEAVYISEACSPLDILPTLSNLFGLEFDSRLLIGRDALSDSSPLVIFNSRSWITDLGRYDADFDIFTPFVDESEIPDGYVASVSSKVDAKFTVSSKILETDYYRVLWEESGLEIK